MHFKECSKEYLQSTLHLLALSVPLLEQQNASTTFNEIIEKGVVMVLKHTKKGKV
jgi:hypothetical protein